MTEPGVIVSGASRIPVRNLWLLMLYASTLFQRNDSLRKSNVEENPDDLVELVVEVLVIAVERRLQRSLGQGYRQRDAVLTRVRGCIDVLATESKLLLAQGRVACSFDELTVDNPRNRLLLTSLSVAVRSVSDRELARRAQALVVVLTQSGVSQRPIDLRAAKSVTLGRNEQDDAEAIAAAKLLLEMMIAAEGQGRRTGRDPEREAATVRKLYESAVRGFYCATLPHPWHVAAGETHRRWPTVDSSPGITTVLPIMKTDIELEHGDRRIIIETKFADALKPGQYGGPRLNRNHVFQLYAYVQSQEGGDVLGANAEGVLLYPTVGKHLDESATIQGHRYRYMTVDLTGSALQIRARLLDVVGSNE